MKFTKMHGIGNDYVYVNCFEETVGDPAKVAIEVSDRHFGIGSDGLILIKPSDVADVKMEMYNADGSLGAMCGNGIRCVAKYSYDHGLVDKDEITVETGSGIKKLVLTVEDGKVVLVRVNMGEPILEAEKIPVRTDLLCPGSAVAAPEGGTPQQESTCACASDGRVIGVPICVTTADGKEHAFSMTCVSMGNPHCVVPVDDVDGFDLEHIGPLFENNPLFPDRINTEFIRVLDRKNVQMRVWERGSGETWACGTGACGTAVACILNGWTDREVTIHLRGGDLKIEWNEEDNSVYMTGPATEVFNGEILID